jgi:hypothetical protein
LRAQARRPFTFQETTRTSARVEEHRQAVGRAKRQADHPARVGWIETQVRQAVEERRDRDPGLEPAEVRAGAEVLTEPEGDVIADVRAVQHEAVGIVEAGLVTVGRPDREHDQAAFRNLPPVEIDGARHLA